MLFSLLPYVFYLFLCSQFFCSRRHPVNRAAVIHSHLLRWSRSLGHRRSIAHLLSSAKSYNLYVNIPRDYQDTSNLFQSPVFKEAFVNTCGIDLEIYNTDGSQGAARSAGIGARYYSSTDEAFKGLKVIEKVGPKPELVGKYRSAYDSWNRHLSSILGS